MNIGSDGAYLKAALNGVIEPVAHGDDWLDFDDWLDVKRFPEYCAFQLVMDILRSPLVWHIVWRRKSDWRRNEDLETWQARAVYSKWRYYTTKYRGVSRSAHRKLTADYFGIDVGDVDRALSRIEWGGYPEVA